MPDERTLIDLRPQRNDGVSGILHLSHEASAAAHVAVSGGGVASGQEDR